jgi:hypothetical protein
MKTFCFTERYIRKKKVQRYSTLILVPIIMVSSFLTLGFFWESDFAKILWLIFLLTLVVFLLRYGINRIYGNDIQIQNNQILYNVAYGGYRGYSSSCFVFQLIDNVEVKRNKIVIHGRIVEESRYGRTLKKMVFPKEIENVDEFIQIAQSMVV